jgi:hypothetical protein
LILGAVKVDYSRHEQEYFLEVIEQKADASVKTGLWLTAQFPVGIEIKIIIIE